MKRKSFVAIWLCALLLAMSTLWISQAIAAQAEQPSGISTSVGRPKASTSFRELMINNPDIRILVEKSIKQASIINPDRKTNPVQSLDELYGFLDYTVTCMPWNIMPEERYGNFSTKCDQSILYVYWLLDQPLEELKDKALFYPSVEYLEPIYTWLTEYNNTWRDFLDSEASWKQEYLDMLLRDPSWNLDKGWYESPDNWHSFNEFFSRKLSNGNARPIAEPNDDRVVVSPADSLPQGVWNIDESGRFYADSIKREDGVIIKDSNFVSVEQLLGEPGAEYAKLFHNGILTHTYLNYDDYHRYHFPVSGVVEAVYKIPYANAVGGVVYWDKNKELYVLESNSLSWQSVETRGCVLIKTDYGMVAVIPVGMGQVSSVNFIETIKPGTKVKKGDELGYFLFGGSDCVMLFEGKSGFKLSVGKGEKGGYSAGYRHVLCREEYGRFLGK
ncbi:Phosphatidylserine decarboxylase-related related protein [Anaerovibrio sp. JC8]|uniref:phosphatidylserine decarboxylase n=1 Tax=Anaerovibrio sp. JC8 TaxID=1240085 RepID=UPI000A0EA400|nr:phosphatidylserine decarboxylase [Anaerovibrio sp. JC8]ORT99368.1 Phosphatidylserine decarboxylase-related related protein [Anaerovibrio sp. JC8]